MPVTKDGHGPYAPATAVIGIIDRYRDRGLPSPVNPDVLGRAGIPASLTPRTLQALTALDLIDEKGNPTAVFDGLRRAPEAEFPQKLAEWLKAAYAEVFAYVDPAKDDETQIRDAFRNYVPMGQQDRMVALFMALCVRAGLMRGKEKANGAAARPSERPLAQRASSPAPKSRSSNPKRQSVPPHNSSLPPAVPAALAGLLATLPSPDIGWTKNKRDAFLAAFASVLDFCVPTTGETPTANGGT